MCVGSRPILNKISELCQIDLFYLMLYTTDGLPHATHHHNISHTTRKPNTLQSIYIMMARYFGVGQCGALCMSILLVLPVCLLL